MLKRYGILIVVPAIIMVFSGCTCNSLEANWGRSYELAKYNQILNPEAEKNLEPVEGLNGWVADTVMGEYQKSFKGQKGTQNYNLNLGSVSSIGQAK